MVRSAELRQKGRVMSSQRDSRSGRTRKEARENSVEQIETELDARRHVSRTKTAAMWLVSINGVRQPERTLAVTAKFRKDLAILCEEN